jgi:hypothetical protein
MVAQHLIGKALRNYFLQFFPDPGKLEKKKTHLLIRKCS